MDQRQFWRSVATHPATIIAFLQMTCWAMLAAGKIPVDSEFGKTLFTLNFVFTAWSHLLAFIFNPKRKPWSNEERAAHGLPPIPLLPPPIQSGEPHAATEKEEKPL